MSRIVRYAIISAPVPAVSTRIITIITIMGMITITGMITTTTPIRMPSIRWDQNPCAIANPVANKSV